MAKQHYVIVVADDDPLINALITTLLEDEGYHVLSCTTGADALQVTNRVRPDLVITDLHMEVKDAGLQLLAQLRAEPTTAGIGVIICSADYGVLHRGVGAPVDSRVDVIPKPFSLDHLLATIQQLLQEVRPESDP